MDSDSGDDPTFTDCQASGSESASGTIGGRKRQLSMPQMVRKAEGNRAKRQAAARRSRSPAGPPPPGAVAAAAGLPAAEPVQLNAATLAEIKRLIDQGNSNVIRTLEAKLESMEKRISILESECMKKDEKIGQLSKQLEQQGKMNEEMDTRLEEMDMNRRLSSLILSCEAFTSHPRNADIEQLVVSVLNERVAGLNMTKADVQAAHKLQNDSKVICRFVKRQLRDTVYEARFNLARNRNGNHGHGHEGARLPPLYISESLTPRNRFLYEELLRARRPENGELVSSVFSRRGIVWCRTERGGANLRVSDEQTLRRILGGRRFPERPRVDRRAAPPRAPSAARPPPPAAPAAAASRPAPFRAAAPAATRPGGSEGAEDRRDAGFPAERPPAAAPDASVAADVGVTERPASDEPADRGRAPALPPPSAAPGGGEC